MVKRDMRVYFVRHGETLLNRSHTHQTKYTRLSKKGEDQARTVGEYLRNVDADLLLTSDHTRAFETAQIIGDSVGLTPLVEPLFGEVRRPARLTGRSHFAPETFWYTLLSVFHKDDPNWHYHDAENFTDIFARVRETFEYVNALRYKYHSVIIVSHSMFISMIVAYLCHDRMLAIRDLLPAFLHIKRMKNCGVIELRYAGGDVPGPCSWKVIKRDVWNAYRE